MTIRRRAQRASLEGLHVSRLADLTDELKRPGDPVRALFADLSLGAWRGHAIAREFAAQLGLPEPGEVQPTTNVHARDGGLGDYSDTVGRLIDAESGGDRGVAIALDLAERVVDALSRSVPVAFAVLAPRFGYDWGRDNQLFLAFLQHGLAGTPHRLIVVAVGSEVAPPLRRADIVWLNAAASPAAAAPADSLLALVPGTLDAELIRILGGAGAKLRSAAPGTRMVIEPAARNAPSSVPGHLHEELAERAAGVEWLRAYALAHSPRAPAEHTLLRDAANRRFGEGGYEIASRLMAAAGSAEDPIDRASATLQAQSMHIAMMDFERAAAAAAPVDGLPPGLVGALHQCKAWGLVMCNRPAEAEPLFAQARALLEPLAGSRYHLYLLNISALNKVRLDRHDEALALEHEIERTLGAAATPDWHVLYINTLNLARLHKLAGRLDRAEEYYARAFATNEGVRSDSDLVYCNVCLAELRALQGPVEPAFKAWFRAALLWISMPVPEALARRVAAAILRRMPAPDEELVEQVSAALAGRVRAAANALGVAPAGGVDLSRTPVFVRSEDATDGGPDAGVDIGFGGPGWTMFGATRQAPAPRFSGPCYDGLARLLVDLAAVMCPSAGIAQLQSIVVDTNLGIDVPGSRELLLGAAVRLGAGRILFGTSALEISTDSRAQLERSCVASLGRSLAFARTVGEVLEVHFKRYRMPLELSALETRLVRSIDRSAVVGDLLSAIEEPAQRGEALAALRHLERARIIEIRLPAPS